MLSRMCVGVLNLPECVMSCCCSDACCRQVEERIAARAAARAAKDFAAADAVRVELSAKGIMLMDSPEGTTWRPGLPDAE
jgi:cysteinyl-tRNA synthetase